MSVNWEKLLIWGAVLVVMIFMLVILWKIFWALFPIAIGLVVILSAWHYWNERNKH